MKTVQYNIDVKFEREMCDDFDVVAKRFPKSTYPKLTLKQALLKQFHEELQEGYDKTYMAGMFKINQKSIKFKPAKNLKELEKCWANRA